MSVDAWITAGMLVVMLSALATSRFGADLVVVGALLMLILLGVVEPADAIRNFANPAVITIGFLYVVAAGLKETGAINVLTARLLGHPKSALQAQMRLIFPVAALSAVANNTPIVATFLPVIHSLSRRTGIAATRLFIPLSFAAILGGLCTLIGTSTTLVVAGQIRDHNKETNEIREQILIEQSVPADQVENFDFVAAGAPELLREFSMFTVAAAGIPVALVGLAYILLMGRKLLPRRVDEELDFDKSKQYFVAMRVQSDSPIIGKSIEQAELRNLPHLYLSRIERADQTILAVGPDVKFEANDILLFVGKLSSVIDLQKIKGLVPVADGDNKPIDYRPRMKLTEVVISGASPLTGRTIRDAGIRTRYNAVVVAVHRHGQRQLGKLGDIILRPGDTLLLETGPEFAKRYRESHEFVVVSELEGSAAPRHERAWMAIGILLLIVGLISFEVLQPMVAAMLGAGLMVLLRCCTGPQARSSIDFQVLTVIGSAFGIGAAMEASGLAQFIAQNGVAWAGSLSPIVMLGIVYFMTVIFTTFITNNAAAVLMFPIALEAANVSGLNPLPFGVAVAIAASAEFTTPIGYQTNLMVMGPGGYKWMDYVRFGGPLTILAGLVAVLFCSFMYGPLS